MKKFIAPTVVFTPGVVGTGQLVMSGMTGFDLKYLVAIINQTAGVVLYATGSATLKYNAVSGISGAGCTLKPGVDTTGISGSDSIQVIYEDNTTSQVVTFGNTNVISTANSSTATLASAGVFTGTSEEVTQYSEARIVCTSNVASATNGLSVQQSTDGTNWDVLDTFTVAAGVVANLSIGISARYFRIVYTNGGTLQTSFRLQTVFHTMRTKPSSVRPGDARTNEIDVEEVGAYLHGFNGTTWDRLRTGLTGAVSAVLGYLNVLPVGKYTTANPTLTNNQWHDLRLDVNGRLLANINPSTVAVPTQAPIAFGTTRVRLTVSGAAPAATRQKLSFYIEPGALGTEKYWIGGVTLDATTNRGPSLLPGVMYEIKDNNDYYIISDTASQVVGVMEV